MIRNIFLIKTRYLKPMILIKLGGSVITDKSEYRKFRKETVSRLCGEIKKSGIDAIIVHGAGSFGHIVAKKFRIADGFENEKQIPAVAQICEDTRELNSLVVKELNKAGIPSVSVPTGSAFIMKNGKLKMKDDSVLKNLVKLGIVPVMFGDVVTDAEKGFGICSGDQIMEKLCEKFDFEKVVFVSDVDGLYLSDPKKNKNAEFLETVNEKLLKNADGKQSVDDVTGGVKEKVKIMLRMCSPERECVLVNGNEKGRLLSLLRGEKVKCTKAEAGKHGKNTTEKRRSH